MSLIALLPQDWEKLYYGGPSLSELQSIIDFYSRIDSQHYSSPKLNPLGLLQLEAHSSL